MERATANERTIHLNAVVAPGQRGTVVEDLEVKAVNGIEGRHRTSVSCTLITRDADKSAGGRAPTADVI